MRRLLFILPLILFAACAHNIPFKKTEGTGAIPAGEVVFLPGSYSPFEVEILKYITSKYSSIKQLKVVPLEQYNRKLNGNLAIRGPYHPIIGKTQEIDFSIVPRGEVAELFELFDRDYIFIVWAPEVIKEIVGSSRGNPTVTYYVTVYGQLFARNKPDTDLGRTDFMAGKTETSCFLSSYTDRIQTNNIDDLLKEACDTIIDEMRTELGK